MQRMECLWVSQTQPIHSNLSDMDQYVPYTCLTGHTRPLPEGVVASMLRASCVTHMPFMSCPSLLLSFARYVPCGGLSRMALYTSSQGSSASAALAYGMVCFHSSMVVSVKGHPWTPRTLTGCGSAPTAQIAQGQHVGG